MKGYCGRSGKDLVGGLPRILDSAQWENTWKVLVNKDIMMVGISIASRPSYLSIFKYCYSLLTVNYAILLQVLTRSNASCGADNE